MRYVWQMFVNWIDRPLNQMPFLQRLAIVWAVFIIVPLIIITVAAIFHLLVQFLHPALVIFIVGLVAMSVLFAWAMGDTK